MSKCGQMVPVNKGESGFQRLEVMCKKKCTRRGKTAEVIVLSQGKVNPTLPVLMS